ncbi:MAG: hypothetical protein GEU88_15370 [Solirubrobacterales bacterium]|nr:hypothetical protein [Solirubrobacterales bacterium]
MGAIVAHNALAALWPLALVALGWHRLAVVEWVGDGVVWGALLLNGASVGLALGAVGVELLAYLPHLPLEWLGLAIPVAGWSAARAGELGPGLRPLVAVGAVALLVLLVAAAVEVYVAPL